MDAALTPREIQARIRAGQSIDELATLSGMPVARIESFATPVLAERAWLAGQASHGQVRREGFATHQTLLELVGDRLASRGLSSVDVTWDAWRGSDRLWTLRASYRSGSALHEAVFRYDPVGRFSIAVNDEARWLIGESAPTPSPDLPRHTSTRPREFDSEPTVDLSQTRRGHPSEGRPGLFDFEPADYAPVRLTEIDGVFDLVPGRRRETDAPDSDDDLYGLLASINEDSVRIYEGLTQPTTEPPAGANPRVTKPSRAKATRSTAKVTPAPPADEAKEPTVRVPKSKKRATVPSWDEIMFGSPQVDN